MRVLKTAAAVLFLAVVLMIVFDSRVHSQGSEQELAADQANVAATKDATYTSGSVDLEGVPEDDKTTYTFKTDAAPPAAGGPSDISPTSSASASRSAEPSAVKSPGGESTATATAACLQPPISNAPANFDDMTNGLIPQGTPVPDCTDPIPGTFLHDKAIFSEIDTIEDGLGPIYNDRACGACHDNPVTGAISQIMELRAGHTKGTTFVDAPGGSLINQRGIPTPQVPPNFPIKNAKVQERVPPLFTAGIISGPPITGDEPTRTTRTSLNTLGDGFVESIASGTLVAIAFIQPFITGGEIHGLPINVPVSEANFQTNPDCVNPNLPCIRRVGRFGWKDQHASLLSFSGDAYLNEIGITNFLVLKENTSLGRFIGFGTPFDPVPDNTACDPPNQNITCGEDTAQDIRVFTEFMRATKAPPRDQDIINQFQNDVNQGASLFQTIVVNGQAHHSCSACHVPAILTAPRCTVINGGTFSVPAALANKIIRPFSDFLLHDVGTGDFIVQNGGQITRTKVRTPPLWGVRTRNQLMHDGAEETFDEAIRRHDGEATSVINLYKNFLTQQQRNQIITFLESL
jgi:Di-haem oxidoreductase, putative peroxidase